MWKSVFFRATSKKRAFIVFEKVTILCNMIITKTILCVDKAKLYIISSFVADIKMLSAI